MNDAKVGRKRSEAARLSILHGALELAARDGYGGLTMDALAAHAGVGKQTIYRWWPSRGAVVLEALISRGEEAVPAFDLGSLAKDVTAFLVASFRATSDPGTAELLRGVVVEAQLDPAFREELRRTFLDARRAALRVVLERARARGELAAGADLELLLDMAFGVLWYRLLMGHAPRDDEAARALAKALCRTVSHRSASKPGKTERRARPST